LTTGDPELSRRRLISVAAAALASAATSDQTAAAAATGLPSQSRAPGAPQFAGKVALVTGATSGMGAVTARALAAAGARVLICGRRSVEGQAIEQSIRASGGEVAFQRTDVTNEAEVKALLEFCKTRFGRLDYAFNNVGTADGTGAPHELSTEQFDLVIATNLRGNFLQLKYEIPLLLAAGGGSIVFNSSIAGSSSLPGKAHYNAAKHGLNAFARTAALEYAKHNIRINVVAPGLIKTEKAMRVLGGDEHKLDARIPMGHIGQSQDVADAVLWLFSDQARYVTGAVLPVDGGQSAA
jgi:NAD(P)-dependent dehydrogenase (short-subunit alcohol dehydrogenase family)